MDILNTINTVKVSGSSGSSVKKISEKSKWQLTDSLKEKIVELAKKDAKNNVYMGNEFMNLRKAEVAKVAPNRAALIGKFNQLMSSGNMGDMKEIQEADKRWYARSSTWMMCGKFSQMRILEKTESQRNLGLMRMSNKKEEK